MDAVRRTDPSDTYSGKAMRSIQIKLSPWKNLPSFVRHGNASLELTKIHSTISCACIGACTLTHKKKKREEVKRE